MTDTTFTPYVHRPAMTVHANMSVDADRATPTLKDRPDLRITSFSFEAYASDSISIYGTHAERADFLRRLAVEAAQMADQIDRVFPRPVADQAPVEDGAA